MPGREVIEDGDLVAGVQERLDRNGSDIAGAAGHENAHSAAPFAVE